MHIDIVSGVGMGFFWKKSKESAGDSDDVLVGHVAETDKMVHEVDAPWVRAQRAHENTLLRLGAQVANWRMFAFFSLALAFVGVGGVVYIGSQSKYIPMTVEVDKLGRTLAVRALTGDDAVTDPQRLVYREMFDLIENLRTVTTDIAANDDHITKGFSRLTGAAAGYARTELRKALPNEVGKIKTVQVQVKTALRLTDRSWQVEWEEHSFDLQGKEMAVDNWKATVGYKLSPSGAEEGIRTNPIGFLVTDLSWMKVI